LSENLFNEILKKEIDFENKLFNVVIITLSNLIMAEPRTSRVFIQEKLNAKAAAGIRKITRNIKLPKKPIKFERFVKINLPKSPPELVSK
jgi:hypothetical protein